MRVVFYGFDELLGHAAIGDNGQIVVDAASEDGGTRIRYLIRFYGEVTGLEGSALLDHMVKMLNGWTHAHILEDSP